MKEIFNLAIVCVVAVAIYYTGYINGASNKLVGSASEFIIATKAGVDKIDAGVETIKSFPAKFGAKMDEIYDKVKNLFKWKRGSDGKIYLDPDSPIYDDVDRELRSSDGKASGTASGP